MTTNLSQSESLNLRPSWQCMTCLAPVRKIEPDPMSESDRAYIDSLLSLAAAEKDYQGCANYLHSVNGYLVALINHRLCTVIERAEIWDRSDAIRKQVIDRSAGK